jgi:hypothetical protein
VLTVKRLVRRLRSLLPWTGFLFLLLLEPAMALARAGGGESYSGGGSGSGGGGGDGGLIYLLIRLWIWLLFRHPVIGIPVTIVLVYAFIQYKKKHATAAGQSWDSAPPQPPAPQASRDLDDLRTLDPEFSVVLFEDFAYALFARAHEARSSERDLEALSPYLSAASRSHLAQRRPVGAPVSNVVVGAMRVVALVVPPATNATPGGPPPREVVTLEFEANMTVGLPVEKPGAEHTHYVEERWRLERDATVQSKPPEKALSFQCPNCGAPFGPEGGDRCQYCGQVVSGGRFDWSVESIDLVRMEERPPALTSDVQEVGTNWPTIFHPKLSARWTELVREDPAVTPEALNARLQLIYTELNAAWSRRDLGGARPYVSDGLFDYLQYWITAYEKQGLRNVLEGMRIVEWKTVKVARDRHYDALTVRLWGSGRDYTVRQATGDVVTGDPKHDRFYSEYWTLIRGSTSTWPASASTAAPRSPAASSTGSCRRSSRTIRIPADSRLIPG